MKILILDKYKITKFNLPEKVEDSFLIPYRSINKKDNIITVEAVDNKWQLKSNGNVNILNGTNIKEQITLEEYNYYTLKILGESESIMLFSLPSKDPESYKLDLKNCNRITIGSDTNCNICYGNALNNNLHAEIKLVNNAWYIAASADDKYRTYLNGTKISVAKLSTGDIIFINGLKIIWMNTFVKINNPKKTVFVKGISPYKELDVVNNTKYTPVSDEEANVDLYKEDEYFFHIPRLIQAIDEKEFVIDPPPTSPITEDLPFLLTLGTSLTMAASSLMMGYSIVESLVTKTSTIVEQIPQLVTTVTMIFGSLIMPKIVERYQKKIQRKREALRQKKYKEYLDKVDKKIQDELIVETQILKANSLTTSECNKVMLTKNRNFWTREITDDDFLNVRLGIGTIDSFVKVKAPEEHFTLDSDNLQEMAFEVDKRSKKLSEVPVNLDISKETILSFVFNCTYKDDYINNILLQLVALHSANDLKLVVLTTDENKKRWDFVKFLPHIWSDDKSIRYFATNLDELKEISTALEEEFKERESKLDSKDKSNKEQKQQNETNKKQYSMFSPYYLIITDDYLKIKNTAIIDSIEKSNAHAGFTLLAISNTMRNLPAKCEKFIEIGEKESCILEKNLSTQSQIIFKNECEKNIDMNAVSVRLSNVPIITKEGLSVLPSSISFLDMYGVGKIEQLNIVNRWQNNNPVASLSAPIGVHADGELFKLDLHEKFHGPHGLVAGSTGSGKSEFIITYILSMCINYHPYEVQFVLIDYKGGGLAGAFENKETGVKVPHLVGTITNLDTAEMNRTLVSISSELKRRQRKFNEVKDKLNESTMDIYKYQKLYREGLIDEPMAHLFIISDEFAELKSQQPEFLDELVSTARIGRSLGVHLILATQKPSGVVNDQIWSNSKFKVCLKVQDRSDSMEMLKRPEAASIREAGRFYLQVGYDDYFDIGQSGWGGAKYVPTDRLIKKIDDSISFVDNVGNVFKSINDIQKKDEATEDMGEQLTNVVKYIYTLAQKDNLVTRKLWLDRIPNVIYLNDIKKKYNYKPTQYLINPVIGEYDNPSQQEQGILNLNLSEGNTLIYGKTGSGKENLLTTVIWSSCVEHTPDEINYYIIDCGAATLKVFNKFPHVGEVANLDEEEKLTNILVYADSEMDRRKQLYADYGGNYKSYCENSGNKEPLLVFIINNYEIFEETYSQYADLITTMYRDGYKYGVEFIITCTTTNSIRSKVAEYFANKMALQLADNYDYMNVLDAPKGLIPFSAFGRGLIKSDKTAYEFQTASICAAKDLNNTIKSASEQLNKAYITRAKKVKTVPDVVTLNNFDMNNIALSSIPVGYDTDTKEPFNYDFTANKFNMVLSNDMFKKLNFVTALIKEINAVENINFKIVDMFGIFKEDYLGIKTIRDNFDNEMILINNEIAKEKSSEKINIYMILGASGLKTKLSNQGQQVINNLFMRANTFEKSFFIFIDNYSQYKNLQLEAWYQSQVDNTNGIWLGEEVGSQLAININNLSLEDKKLDFENVGFAVNRGEHNIIKYVIDAGDKNEE